MPPVCGCRVVVVAAAAVDVGVVLVSAAPPLSPQPTAPIAINAKRQIDFLNACMLPPGDAYVLPRRHPTQRGSAVSNNRVNRLIVSGRSCRCGLKRRRPMIHVTMVHALRSRS